MKNLTTLSANIHSDGANVLPEGAMATTVSPEDAAVVFPQSLISAPVSPSLPLPISPSVLVADGDSHECLSERYADRQGDSYGRIYRGYGKDHANGKGFDNGDGGNGTDEGSDEDGSGCLWFVERLSAFQDGELEISETVAVADHLDVCDRCSRIFAALQSTDNLLEREWRMSAPLPSSLQCDQAIDAIMAALPGLQQVAPSFPNRRVHARSRWMRFATGIVSAVALLASLWASYHLGYVQGRQCSLSNHTHEILTNSLTTP